MNREHYLKLADRYEALGRSADAAELRAKAAALPSATAPTTAPSVAPMPAATRRPARAPAPAEQPVEFIPEAQQDEAAAEYQAQLEADVRAGRAPVSQLNEYLGYTLTDEQLADLQAPGMPVEPAKPRVRIVVPFGSDMVPSAADAEFQAGEPLYGRPVDEPQMAGELRQQLDQMESDLIRQYIAYGYTVEGAREAARKASVDVLARRVGPEGDPTTRGEGGIGSMLPIPPFFRESRIDFRTDPSTYVEPSGQRRPATPAEQVIETFARQQIISPDIAAKARQTRALQRELAFQDIPGSLLYTDEYAADVRQQIAEETDPYLRNVLSTVDPGTGVGIETPLGAAIRQTGLISTMVNEAVLGLPLFYDVDDEGNATNPDQFAFKVNDFVTSALQRMGMSAADAKDVTSGIIGGTAVPTGIPMPFQGINRKGLSMIDPTGMRGASETETYLGDVVTSLAKGRFLGDELYSIPAYTEELASGAFNTLDQGTGERLKDIDESLIGQSALYAPLVLGAGAEMIYGIGPISALGKVARTTGTAARAAAVGGAARAAGAAAQAVQAGETVKAAQLLRAAEAMKTGARAADFVANPVEYSKKVRLIRAGQDLLDEGDVEKPVLDVLMDRSEIKTVLADAVAKDTLSPYLIARQIINDPNATVGDLRAMAGDSSAGREFLRSLGVADTMADTVPWGTGRLDNDALQDALLSFKASVYRPAIETVLRNADLDEAEQARRILAILEDQDINELAGMTPAQRSALRQTYGSSNAGDLMDELAAVADGIANPGDLAPLLQRLKVNVKYLPISNNAPMMQSLHAFGQELQRGLPRGGPVAESFARRLGGDELINTAPDLVREAALGAGSRAVASTFENLVPEDLVLVTDTLMVPRQKLSPDVLNKVSDTFNGYGRGAGPLFVAQVGPTVNGRPTMVFRWDMDSRFARDEIFGPNTIARSPARRAVLDALEANRPLTESEHHFLTDAALTAAYRDVLGETAAEALLAGEQTQRAAQPSVGLGLLSAAQERVPGLATGERAVAQARPLTEAREPSVFTVPSQALAITKNILGSAVLKASKKFPKIDYTAYKTTFKDQTPFITQQRGRKIEEAVAAIPDQFQREVRAEALRTDAESAFNTVLQRRIAAAVTDAIAALQRRVDDLVAQGMAETDAWSTVAYQQRAGKAAGGLGSQVSGGVIAQAKQQAQTMAVEEVQAGAWAALLRTFFGPTIFSRLVGVDENALRRYIVTTDAAGNQTLIPVTLQSFRDVLARIRKDNPELDVRGLARPAVPYGDAIAGFFQWMGKQDPRNLGPVRLLNDAVLDTAAAWAMGMDRQRIVAREATAMLDANPWMRGDLSVGQFTDSPDRLLRTQYAAEEARATLLADLTRAAALRSGVLPARAERMAMRTAEQELFRASAASVAGAADTVPGTPFQRTARGPLSESLDQLTLRAWRNLTPAAKTDIINYVYGKMLENGDRAPDLRAVLYEGLDDPKLNLLFFEKMATTKALQLLIEQGQTAMARSIVSPDDGVLIAAIENAQRSGLSYKEVIEVMRKALLRNALQSFVEPAVLEMQANSRAYGWAPDLEQTRKAMTGLVDQINPDDPRFGVAGQDFMQALANLQAASKDGKLAENLDAIQRSEKLQRALGGEAGAAGEYVLQVLLDTLSLPRTIGAAGLLGGGYYIFSDETTGGQPIPVPLPLPNTRYLGTNLITAPLIIATTLGTTGAIRYLRPRGGAAAQAGEVALQASAQLPEVLRRPLVNSLGSNPGALDEVLFTTRTGQPITRGELDQLMREHNISLTRGGLEFANAFARDLARDARLTAEGVKAPALRQYLLRNMDPTRTGFWQYAANATDRAFRQNVFATALQEGLTAPQAAQLARNSVLDYGNVRYSGGLNRYVMFLAFREAMTREVIEALARDPDTLNRTLLLHRDLQKQMDDELNVDHTRFRLPIGNTKIFDQTAASRLYGPTNPALSMYGDLVRFAAHGLQVGAPDIPPGTLAQAVADESLTPLVDMVMADALARPSNTGRGQKVDDVWVAYAIENSPDVLWPWLKEEYNIVPVARDEERKSGRLEAQDPAAPFLGKVEYRFQSTQDHARFIRDMAVLQTLGFQRTMEDYTKMGLTYNVSDYIDPKRRGLPTTFGFAFGLETPLGAQSQMGAIQKAIRLQQQQIKVQTPRD